jgi:RNA polymerase sigma-70 factor (ECF subfamily)
VHPVETRQETRLKQLMLASLAGDAHSYGVLLSEVARHLRSYFLHRLADAYKGDADDLVQETLMALHTRRATYETGRPFTAWLHAIARYKLIDHFRRNRIRATVPLDDAEYLFAQDPSDAATDRMDVDKLLQSIPEKSRDLIYRTRIEGQSIAEVAQSTGLSESSIKVGIHRGIKAIAAKLKGRADDNE